MVNCSFSVMEFSNKYVQVLPEYWHSLHLYKYEDKYVEFWHDIQWEKPTHCTYLGKKNVLHTRSI